MSDETKCPMCAAGNVPKPLFQYGPRDWPEDEKLNDDNAHYRHKCPKCENTFIGHKRRNGGLCKICWSLPSEKADIIRRDVGKLVPDSNWPDGGPLVEQPAPAEPLVLEFRKCPEPPDIPCGPSIRTYVPVLPGKHRRRR